MQAMRYVHDLPAMLLLVVIAWVWVYVFIIYVFDCFHGGVNVEMIF